MAAIIDYIAESDVTAAERVGRKFMSAFQLLAANPRLGHRRADLSADPELRCWKVYSYLVIYWLDDGWVHVTAVVSGHRDVSGYLESRD